MTENFNKNMKNVIGNILTKEKNCTTCKWFSSYYEEYDQDPYEPTDCGRCKNLTSMEKYDRDDYAHEDEVCADWESNK